MARFSAFSTLPSERLYMAMSSEVVAASMALITRWMWLWL